MGADCTNPSAFICVCCGLRPANAVKQGVSDIFQKRDTTKNPLSRHGKRGLMVIPIVQSAMTIKHITPHY